MTLKTDLARLRKALADDADDTTAATTTSRMRYHHPVEYGESLLCSLSTLAWAMGDPAATLASVAQPTEWFFQALALLEASFLGAPPDERFVAWDAAYTYDLLLSQHARLQSRAHGVTLAAATERLRASGLYNSDDAAVVAAVDRIHETDHAGRRRQGD